MKLTFNKLNERFARFAPPLFLSGQDLYVADTVQNHKIGTMAYASGGRIFRYSLNGTTALVTGNLIQASVQDTSYENMAVLASPIIAAQNGAQTVNITNGTATITNAQYVDGTVGVYTAGGEAVGGDYDIFGISGTLTTGGALVVTVDRPITVAWTTALKVSMKRSPWSGVIQYPVTTQTEMPVGVAPWALTASTSAILQYGWIQTHGPVTVLSDNSTYAVGSGIVPSLAVAGAVGVNVAGTTHTPIGVARMAAASAHGIAAFLNID